MKRLTLEQALLVPLNADKELARKLQDVIQEALEAGNSREVVEAGLRAQHERLNPGWELQEKCKGAMDSLEALTEYFRAYRVFMARKRM